jgi:hypothetical protein
VGFKSSTISVKNFTTGDGCVKFHVQNKSDGFEWFMVVVYGAAQDAQKTEFLAELVCICDDSWLPMLVGRDFNIIRRQEEKNNDHFNARWPFMFNAIIESLNMREIVLSGRQYTWANRRDTPMYEKLDRILASIEWEQKFPLIIVRLLTRSDSDHTLILLYSGVQAHHGNKAHFLLNYHG